MLMTNPNDVEFTNTMFIVCMIHITVILQNYVISVIWKMCFQRFPPPPPSPVVVFFLQKPCQLSPNVL